ncbi:class I SAM-dependent methyltransferase [Actinomadura sp. KC216]|uniref:class I SAM-dependent DNA methyltransferase n=1 Tax=Actinomadura sp. KC216 TaxID=2530370 RepID=UPI001A9EA1E9|nr:class I SAM-dependent methyltransferase [Actinomadura sp. KC216]
MNHDDTRQGYDTVAESYAARFRDELAAKPLDCALLASIIEQTAPDAPVADLGCGPGHIAAWLSEKGLKSVGIDLSAAMVSTGRREHPNVEFREGDLLELPAADGEFGSAIAFYSIIHLAPSELPRAFAEVRRTLRPEGLFLVAFHVGTHVRHLDEWWGHKVNIDFQFFEPAHIADLLEAAGFKVEMRMDRVHHPDEVETRRAYLLARRRA